VISVEEAARELDTIHLDNANAFAATIGGIRELLATEIFGYFAFDVTSQLRGFHFTGMTRSAVADYRNGIISTERTWGFFEPGSVPSAQRNRLVVCQAEEFLEGGTPTLRRLGLSRTVYRKVRGEFVDRSSRFYDRHGFWRTWQVRAVLTDGPRVIGWFGGLSENRPHTAQRKTLHRLLPSFQRRIRYEAGSGGDSHGLIDALMQQLDRPGFLATPDGRILHANGLGSASLVRAAEIESIRAAVRTHGSSAYDVLDVDSRGLRRLVLVVGKTVRVATDATGLGLTPRQECVARELCRGHSNTQIAAALGISERTVEVHLTAIYARLGVPQRAAAVAMLFARKR
jgi:DNA-binding CsgD family transcriptional regulator